MNMSLIFAFKKLSIDWAQSRGEIRLFIDENMKQSFSECQWDGWCDASLSHLHVWDLAALLWTALNQKLLASTHPGHFILWQMHIQHTQEVMKEALMVSTAIRYGMNIKMEGFGRGNMVYRPFSLVAQRVALTHQTFRIPVSKWYSCCEIPAV